MNLFYLHSDTSGGSRLQLFATEAQRQAAQRRLLIDRKGPHTANLHEDWALFCEEASEFGSGDYYDVGETEAPVAPLKDRYPDTPGGELNWPIEACDSTEVHGVRKCEGPPDTDGKYCLEQCEDAEAEMFSVYVHHPGKGLDCVGDFTLKADAEAYAAELDRQHGWKSIYDYTTHTLVARP